MPNIKNTFIAGRMNKDIDSRLMPEGEYRNATNIKVSTSSGGDVGAIENVLSNEKLTSLVNSGTSRTIGAYFDPNSENIYWFVTGDVDLVLEYNTRTQSSSVVLYDSSAGVLNFDPNYLITGATLIEDTDNDRRLLLWTDGLNPIRCINVETAKSYPNNGFTDRQISLMKAAPLYPIEYTLGNTPSDKENDIESRFLRFSYRYRYEDGEVSALAPFTETTFLPKNFNYDYSTSSNESMINQFNEVNLSFNTGPSEVAKVELVFKESNSNTVYIIDSFDKEGLGWSDNSTETYTFSNNKNKGALASDQLTRLFDAVPLKAKALTMVGNRLILGNYTENYNITDESGDEITIDFELELDTTSTSVGSPSRTMRSNRDYEVGIVYLDDYGRMTTVLTSPTNTINVPNENSVTSNKIRVIVKNDPPAWATSYRFFLKQTKVDYEVIVPSVFYRDGIYVWIKVEGNETQKFSEGDFLYVKSGSQGILSNVVQTRVLEVKDQEANFLESDDVETIEQLAGKYFKVKPSNFRLSEDDFQEFNYVGEAFRSRSLDKNFGTVSGASQTYVEAPIYYGSVGLNDLTLSGSYTGSTDIRYRVEISAQGLPDSFRWSDDDGATWSADTPITGSSQSLNNGLSITFGSTENHEADDSWIISAKAKAVTDEWNKAGSNDGSPGDLKRRMMMIYKGKDTSDETIKAGASITIRYDDTGSDDGVPGQIAFTQTFISTSNYANIEEWFFGDNVIDTLEYPTQEDRVVFRRGVTQENGVVLNIDGRYSGSTPNEPMHMVFSSSAHYSGGERLRGDVEISILELEGNVIFETIPDNNDAALFYEVGRTYDIVNGRHMGYDGNDTNQTAFVDAELVLPSFNAFSWGNGFESYKIKDLFNEKTMLIDSRPSGSIEVYKQENRVADLTYSKVFEQSTNFNGLNEFNLSTGNFLSMDDKYGSIQKLFSAETNIEVYQEDKIHYVLYNKDILFDADGSGNIRESSNVLGSTPVPWPGEYGISRNPESLAFYGGSRYWIDSKRGVVLTKSQSGGITEIVYGMKDFFRDSYRNNPDKIRLGAFDLSDREFVITDGSDFTVSYNPSVGGYSSFYSFSPEWMGGMNNEFYSFKDGELYRHYDESNSIRNNFYGVQYESDVKLIMPQEPSVIKVAKTVFLEGNKPWDVSVTSYLNNEVDSVTRSSLLAENFLNKEGKYYAHLRGNEISTDFTARNVYGVGQVSSTSGNDVNLTGAILGGLMSTGDLLYDQSDNLLGTIQDYDKENGVITLNTSPSVGAGVFVYAVKNSIVEGSAIRGYNFEVDITDSTTDRTELFLLGINAFKSLPS